MSNSPLVNYTKISPNSTNPRRDKIKKITIHHMAGNLSVETCGNVFASPSRQASSNYGIGSDGRVGMYVEEKNRAWTSSSAANDNQAVTIEVANDQIGGNWHVSDTALNKLIELCVNICKRNGIEKLIYTGDASGNLTRHNMFTATTCPGPYLQSKFPYIVKEVNKRLHSLTQKEGSKVEAYRQRLQMDYPAWAYNINSLIPIKKFNRGDCITAVGIKQGWYILDINGTKCLIPSTPCKKL